MTRKKSSFRHHDLVKQAVVVEDERDRVRIIEDGVEALPVSIRGSQSVPNKIPVRRGEAEPAARARKARHGEKACAESLS
jgi:hypothetical protein